VPILLKRFYPQYQGIRTVYTIHNIEYQGKMPRDFAFDVLGLGDGDANTLTYEGSINLMKGAIVTADAVTTVSETYADEILTEYYAHGLHFILRDCRDKLSGIVNGIDMALFDPATDPALFMNYNGTVAGLKGKARNKLFLQEELGLRPEADVPLVAMVGRLVSHKGLDLVEHVIDDLMATGIQLTILGTGEARFEEMAKQAAERYPGRVSANILFDSKLASRIYAGADLFLMPSKSEPCGLAQMVAMRYGTLPIVRETGGLKDTVPAYHPTDGSGRGFTFVDYNAHEMLYSVQRAVALYRDDRKAFTALQKRNMKTNFGWTSSVKRYERLYKKLKR
jgi:starch synthase